MDMSPANYLGPPIDDTALLDRLPVGLSEMLQRENGFIRFDGGLHVRGACREPTWHSLRAAWEGPHSFAALYPGVEPGDVPFAEDALGDQFLLRGDSVLRLTAGLGDLEDLGVSLPGFFARAEDDPVEFLGLHPLLRFQSEGGRLLPGMLLAAYPPFWTMEAEEGVDLRAVPNEELRSMQADIARQVRDLPEGTAIRFDVLRGPES